MPPLQDGIEETVQQECERLLRETATGAEIDFDHVVKSSGVGLTDLIAELSVDGIDSLQDKIDGLLVRVIDGGDVGMADAEPSLPAAGEGAPVMPAQHLPPPPPPPPPAGDPRGAPKAAVSGQPPPQDLPQDSLASLSAELSSGPPAGPVEGEPGGSWDPAAFAGSLEGMREAMMPTAHRVKRPLGSKQGPPMAAPAAQQAAPAAQPAAAPATQQAAPAAAAPAATAAPAALQNSKTKPADWAEFSRPYGMVIRERRNTHRDPSPRLVPPSPSSSLLRFVLSAAGGPLAQRPPQRGAPSGDRLDCHFLSCCDHSHGSWVRPQAARARGRVPAGRHR